jgi:putative SOS response-associated peptidase YedK
MRPESKPRPVNNIADLSKPIWMGLAKKPQERCFIPLTGFAEPEGPKGSKNRIWVTGKGQPIFAWGGLWRDSAEWGLSIRVRCGLQRSGPPLPRAGGREPMGHLTFTVG